MAPTSVSTPRIARIWLAATAGWLAGFYAGVFVVLSLVGFDDLEGRQFVAATSSLGAIASGLAAAAVSPGFASPALRAIGAALALALAAALVVDAVGGDFAVAILGGGAAVTPGATAGAVRGAGQASSMRISSKWPLGSWKYTEAVAPWTPVEWPGPPMLRGLDGQSRR